MATSNLNQPTSAANGNIPYIGATANDDSGTTIRESFDRINDRLIELYGSQDGSNVVQTPFVDGDNIKNNTVTHSNIENRYTEVESISTLAGTVSFDCSNGAIFKLSGDITGAYTIDLSSYKKGQVISIYPIKGNQTLNLDAQGTSTNTFNKIGGVDYEDDGTSNNILQIECVDDSATDPVFFYSLSTYAASSSDI